MRRFATLWGLLIVSALVLGANPAFGQVAKGTISGTVVDATGAVIPGATATATKTATNEVYTTTTGPAGLFRLPLLPVGAYTVEITKPGFRKLREENVSVSAGVDRGLGTLTLQVGELALTVEVAATTPLLQAAEAQVSNTLSGTTLVILPGIAENQGLDFLALTLPGVSNSRDVSFSNSNGPDFSVNGIRSRSNDQQIDGQNNNDNSVAGPSLFVSNPDFVQEYQITTNQFGAEYGRNSGSVVNIITKSGTNNWHGAFVGTESNSVLNSLSNTQKFFQKLKRLPRFNDEFTSGTLGGPIMKDRVFVFGGFDDEIFSSKGVFSTGNFTPTPIGLAAMQGCYPGSATVAALATLGPYGITGGNPTPSGTPKTLKLTRGAFAGFTPNNVDGTCRVQVAGVQRTLGDSTHQFDWLIRMDVVASSSDHIYGRYIYNRSTSFNTDAFGTAAAGYPANIPDLNQQVGLSWAHTFSGRMVNEARFSYGRLNVQFGGNTIGNTVPNQGQIDQALSRVVFSDPTLLGFGPATNAPQGRIVNTYQFQDNWSYLLGRHQLKAGVNYTRQRSPNIFLPFINGRFRFANLSGFAQDVPNRIEIGLGDPRLNFLENDTFLYVGDDFKLKPNLTLNLGLTWSYYGQPANLFHDITTARESNAATAFWNPALPLSVRTLPSIPSPKKSFGPSVGFAYTPGWGGWLTGNGKTVLRGGYRLTYDPPYYNIYLNISSSAPEVLLQTIPSATARNIPMPAAPFGPAVRTLLAPSLTLGVFDPRNFNQTNISPDFGPDKVHQWNFGIQREVVKGAVFEARYVGNHGSDLFQSINSNPFIADLAATFPKLVPAGLTPCPAASAVVPAAVGRVDCTRGRVRQRTNTAFSDYNALQLEFRTNNLFKQLTMRTGYTFSKTTDNVTEIFGTFAGGNSLAFSQNPLDFKTGEHGLSGLNFRHIWTLSLIEELPFQRAQHGVIGHIVGGWGVAATYILESGQPYTPVQFALGSSSGAVGIDTNFDSVFAGVFETLRPFASNPSAPANTVGAFAADACAITEVGCALPANTLVDFAAANSSAATQTVVTKDQVRLIVNGGQAQTVFGTAFGNAARNSLRDAKTNLANISIFKNVKFRERATLQWRVTMLNAFNHPNFSSIDPFLDDAGSASEGTGFGIPSLFTGSTLADPKTGQRSIRFGLRVTF